MKVEVIIQKSDNRYELVINPHIDYDLDFGLFGEGKNVEEAKESFYNSLEDMRTLFEEESKPFPNDLEFTFKYHLPAFLEHYSKVFSFAALERLTGVSQGQLSHYVQGVRNPSQKTVKKIEDAIQQLSKDLHQVHFV